MPTGFDDRYDYRVDLLRRRNRVTARIGDTVLAETERCILVDEQDHGIVFYVPKADVRMDLLQPSDHRTVCPFKGEASHFDAEGVTTVAWTYEDPHPQVEALRDHIAFYQDRVQVQVGVATPAVSWYKPKS